MTMILHYPKFKAFAANGVTALNGGKVYTYEAGTSTPKATYTDQSGSTPNANPVILDSRGEADIWAGTGSYKIVVKTSADVTLITEDNITADVMGTLALSSGSSLIGYIQAGTGAVATTLQTRIRQQSISVKEFGAVGDGVTDDTASIQLAFDQVASGGYLVFPKGNYKISTGLSVTLTGDIEIDADNAKLTSVIADATTTGIITINGGSSYSCRINNLIIKGTASVSGGVSGIKISSCLNSEVNSCEVKQLSGYGIFADLCTNIKISNNTTISNKTAGIAVSNSSDILISENYVEGNGVLGSGNGYGITLLTSVTSANKRATISNNCCFNPIRKGIDIHSGVGVLITGNYVINTTGFQDTTSSGIYAVSESTSKDVRQVMIHDNYVDCTGSGTSTIGITVGTNNDSPGVATASEFFSVKGNTVRNCNNTSGVGVYCQIAAAPAVAFDSIIISENILLNACGSTSSVIYIQNVNNPPDRIDIHDNTIVCSTNNNVIRVEYGVYVKIINNIVRMYSGTAISAIYSPATTTATLICGNQLSGTFTTNIVSNAIGTDNSINGTMISSKVFNGSSGSKLRAFEKTFELRTGAGALALNLADVTTPISQSNVFFYIEIIEDTYDNGAKTLYECYVWGRYSAAVFSGAAATVDVKKTVVAGGTPPTLAWINIVGTSATLELTMNTTYSASYIRVNGTTFDGTILLL